ncbi:MAG: hypothetical protein K0S68_1151 [Candidatus Saccharibacteria bacterium]|nr:hypothetical protein [Candidatus Saccharibacteria bacterium]
MKKIVLAGLAVGGAAAAAAVPRVREAAVDTYYRAQDARPANHRGRHRRASFWTGRS